MKIPFTFLIEVIHRPGSLAQVLQAVASMQLTVEGLDAVSRTQDLTTWELSLNMDPGRDAEIRSRVDALSVARVLGHSDRVFDRHRGGKIATRPTLAIDDLKVLRDIYTPGVARVCLAIQDDPGWARDYTARDRTVAILTNGTAILGLGDIGPLAGLPVMEGKAALFAEFGDLSGVPILTESHDVDEIVRTMIAIAPSFGAVQIEDIAAPDCFEIESRLAGALNIPVLHDDQHGTAVVVLAALMSAERLADFSLQDSVVGQIGLGAAGLGISRLLLKHGVRRMLGADLSDEALARLRTAGGEPTSLPELMAESDVVIATTGVEGLIKPEWIREGMIVFALSNPDPEIEAVIALEHGAKFAADGRNINNVLAFPGLFRGAMEAEATCFTNEMLLAAATAISEQAVDGTLVPSPLSQAAHDAVTAAVTAAVQAGGTPIAYAS